jgi:uncharacterized protein YggE
MRVAAFVACGVLLLAAGCGGSKHTSSATPTQQATAKLGTSSGYVILRAASGQQEVAGVPAAALPGLTVLGTAEQSAKPDRALVGLTIGAGSDFGSSGPSFELVERSEIDPVIAALKKAGAEQIAVDRFGQGIYGPQGAAQISFSSTHPDEVDKVIAAAQDAARKHTNYNLQAANVVFSLSNCPALEQKAWQAALADAATRARRLASLSGVKLGNILAVSEATISSSPYAPAATGCQALRLPTAANVVFPSTVENTEQKVTVAVTLQVTYAVAAK